MFRSQKLRFIFLISWHCDALLPEWILCLGCGFATPEFEEVWPFFMTFSEALIGGLLKRPWGMRWETPRNL
jgi:hypothetical protein